MIEQAALLVLPDGPISYIIRRSPRSRRLRVTIDPQRGVIVSLPPASRRGWSRADGLIDEFLRERERWLRRHLSRFADERSRLAERGGLRDGSSLRYRGELHRLRIVRSDDSGSTVSRNGADQGDELVVSLGLADRRPIAEVLRDWLKDRATLAIQREVEHHAVPLRVGPSKVTLRDPRTRWGSASRDGRLSFSWRLVLAPADALETVVVHELAHLRYFGHGPRFWALVATRKPDHRAWRRWLREHSLELHSALQSSHE